jgi:integrase
MPRRSRSGQRGLYKDGDRYTIDLRWRDPVTGERRRYSEQLPAGTTATAAKERARKILSSALAGNFNPKQAKPIRLYEALDKYLEWSATNTPKSYRSKKCRVTEIKRVLSDRQLIQVSAFTLEQFKRDRGAQVIKGARARINLKGEVVRPAKPDRHVGAAAINRALMVLKHLLRLACEWGLINPTAAQDRAIRGVRQLKEPPGRKRDLLPDEEVKLMAGVPAGIRPIIETSIYSGMRRSEVALLKKAAVNFATKEIILTDTKNGETRAVAMSDRVVAIVERAMAASPCEYVFVSRYGRPYAVNSVSKGVGKAVDKVGLSDLHLHDMRHAYGTRSRRAGVDLDVLQVQMGHKSPRMTSRYARIATSQQHEAVAKLAAACPVASPLPDSAPTTSEKPVALQVVK